MKRIDVRAVSRALYQAYYQDFADYARRNIFPNLEQLRQQGFSDSLGQLAEDSEKLSHSERENWRLNSVHELDRMRMKVFKALDHAAALALFHDAVLKADIIVALFTAFVMLFSGNLAWILIPIAVVIIDKLIRAGLAAVINYQMEKAFYDHGYNEGIIYLADTHNICNVDISTPLKF